MSDSGLPDRKVWEQVCQFVHCLTGVSAFFRDTMIQALRCVVQPAGNKMSDGVRRALVTTLTSLLTHDDDSTRLCAAGALGVLVPWLPPEELRPLLTHHVLGKHFSDSY